MEELKNALEMCNNIEGLHYDVDSDTWFIDYKNTFEVTEVHSDDLIEFLQNA